MPVQVECPSRRVEHEPVLIASRHCWPSSQVLCLQGCFAWLFAVENAFPINAARIDGAACQQTSFITQQVFVVRAVHLRPLININPNMFDARCCVSKNFAFSKNLQSGASLQIVADVLRVLPVEALQLLVEVRVAIIDVGNVRLLEVSAATRECCTLLHLTD